MILYIVLGVVGIVACLCVVFGGLLLFKPTGYDSSATATVTSVQCQEGTGKCNITLRFEDKEGNEITRNAIVKGSVKEGSTRGILYDSANPSNFYPSQPPVRMIGAGLLIGGLLLLIGAGAGAYFAYRRTSLSASGDPVSSSASYPPLPSEPSPSPQPSQSPMPSPTPTPSPVDNYDVPSRPTGVDAADQMVFDATAAARRTT
jgi:cell division septation protein DedD